MDTIYESVFIYGCIGLVIAIFNGTLGLGRWVSMFDVAWIALTLYLVLFQRTRMYDLLSIHTRNDIARVFITL